MRGQDRHQLTLGGPFGSCSWYTTSGLPHECGKDDHPIASPAQSLRERCRYSWLEDGLVSEEGCGGGRQHPLPGRAKRASPGELTPSCSNRRAHQMAPDSCATWPLACPTPLFSSEFRVPHPCNGKKDLQVPSPQRF